MTVREKNLIGKLLWILAVTFVFSMVIFLAYLPRCIVCSVKFANTWRKRFTAAEVRKMP
jgi:hypothetical protein